jgi:hypothetical protein
VLEWAPIVLADVVDEVFLASVAGEVGAWGTAGG